MNSDDLGYFTKKKTKLSMIRVLLFFNFQVTGRSMSFYWLVNFFWEFYCPPYGLGYVQITPDI